MLMPIDRCPWSERYGWLNDRYDMSWQIDGARRHCQAVPYPVLMFTCARADKAEEPITEYRSIFS